MSITLFGSKARGDAGPDSDVDVLVRLADDDWQLGWAVRRLAARVSLEHDVLLSVRAIGPKQWERMERYRVPLYQGIQAEGLDLTPMRVEA
jgi:predicted nucleotidyltransferase